jgi:hypothetical protein
MDENRPAPPPPFCPVPVAFAPVSPRPLALLLLPWLLLLLLVVAAVPDASLNLGMASSRTEKRYAGPCRPSSSWGATCRSKLAVLRGEDGGESYARLSGRPTALLPSPSSYSSSSWPPAPVPYDRSSAIWLVGIWLRLLWNDAFIVGS